MGELDLELGGRQKNTANASMEQRKQESQLFDDNESEKNEEHSSSVQIGLFVLAPLKLLAETLILGSGGQKTLLFMKKRVL